MSKQFLLPCKCGKDIVIEIAQAGQTVVCQACQEPVDVPTMRGIRDLEPASVDDEQEEGQAWSSQQGMMFAIGLTVTVLFLALSGLFLVKRLQVPTSKPDLSQFQRENAMIDDLSADQVWDLWSMESSYAELGPWENPAYVENRRVARVWTILFIVTLLIAACGIASTASAFYVKPNKPKS